MHRNRYRHCGVATLLLFGAYQLEPIWGIVFVLAVAGSWGAYCNRDGLWVLYHRFKYRLRKQGL
jgi:hypothetical protein